MFKGGGVRDNHNHQFWEARMPTLHYPLWTLHMCRQWANKHSRYTHSHPTSYWWYNLGIWSLAMNPWIHADWHVFTYQESQYTYMERVTLAVFPLTMCQQAHFMSPIPWSPLSLCTVHQYGLQASPCECLTRIKCPIVMMWSQVLSSQAFTTHEIIQAKVTDPHDNGSIIPVNERHQSDSNHATKNYM